jgi:hypothetical protein
MWQINTYWFDIAVVMSIFAIGNILFGHFEEHNPKWRRLLKVVIVLAMVLGLISTAGRGWAYLFIAMLLAGAAYIHLRWLPKHGINGWTGEPKDKYLELVRAKRRA